MLLIVPENAAFTRLSQQQWDDFQRLARQFVSAIDDEIGNGRFNLRQGELEVQGSRVPGSTKLPRPSTHPDGISDIDILLRVGETTFNALVDDARQHNPNFPHQMNTEIADGRLGRFSFGSRWWNPRIHSAFWDEFAKPLDLPFDIQFSIVKEGSTFDNGPFMPIGGQ